MVARFRVAVEFIVVLLLLSSVEALYELRLSPGPITTANGVAGRVEVLPAGVPYLPVEWIPMCDFLFTDAAADYLCKSSGYACGRKYYSQQVTFPTDTTVRAAIMTQCGPARRRLQAAAGGSEGDESDARRRELLALGQLDLWGEYDGPVTSAVQYDGYIKAKDLTAPACNIVVQQRCPSPYYFAGIECTDLAAFPTAPPPLSSPPSPPPPPPSKLGSLLYISHLEANAPPDGPFIEPNFCTLTTDTNTGIQTGACAGRVELKVADPDNPALVTYAPLCFDNAADPTFAESLAFHVCSMAYDCPACKTQGQHVEPWPRGGSDQARTAHTVPTAVPLNAGDFNAFNPKYKRWARVTNPGGAYSLARILQDSSAPAFTLTPERCDKLFAVTCKLVQSD